MKWKLLLLSIATAGAVWYGIEWSNRIDPEMVAAQRALQQAVSWQTQIVANPPSGAGIWATVSVECPDRMEIEVRGARQEHSIRIGRHWWRNDISYPNWTRVPDNNPAPDPCAYRDQGILVASPAAKAMAIGVELDRALRHHESIARGGLRSAGDQSCRDWTISRAYTLCINENTGLPVQFLTLDGTVTATFTHWNEDLGIHEPQNAPYVPWKGPELPEVPDYVPPRPSY